MNVEAIASLTQALAIKKTLFGADSEETKKLEKEIAQL